MIVLSEGEFDWVMMYCGMLQDGCSKAQALAQLKIMECPRRVITFILTNMEDENGSEIHS